MSQVIITLNYSIEAGLLSEHFKKAGYNPILFSAYSRCEDRRKLSALLKGEEKTRFVVSSAVCGDGDAKFAVAIQKELLATQAPSLLMVYGSQVGKGHSYAEDAIKENPQERHLISFLNKTPFDDDPADCRFSVPTLENVKQFDFLVHRADVWFRHYGDRKPK